jgi:hypothetical protein
MSKLNRNSRKFNTVFRSATIVRPADYPRDHQFTHHNYIDVNAIDMRGTFPIVHMVDQDTFVRMAVLAGHVKLTKQQRKVLNGRA